MEISGEVSRTIDRISPGKCPLQEERLAKLGCPAFLVGSEAKNALGGDYERLLEHEQAKQCFIYSKVRLV